MENISEFYAYSCYVLRIEKVHQVAREIEVWLQENGFGKYAKAFVDNDIGLDILSELTEGHLHEIGVTLGDRLRLLRVIRAKFQTAIKSTEVFGERHDTALDHIEQAAAAPNSVNDSERRPLTVMFCDLADSTALSTRLDPEDLQDVIRAYQEVSAEHVRNYEGYVAKYMGDGILVYFGYPQALERNAERAVHSALEIVDAMTALNQTLGVAKGVEIAVRIGIATGTVMVGEVVGDGMAQERTVIGEAPNMASRLQGLAGRNGIVIGALTKQISGDTFSYQDLGIHQLKGISEPTQAWNVTGSRDKEASKPDVDVFDAIPRHTLVGRDEEIGLLRRAWQSIKGEARGQVITLSGEAGIGKSSLIDGLKEDVQTEGWPQLTMRCSPFRSNSPLHPVIEHFKRLARFQPEDDDTDRLDKIERMLDRYAHPNTEAVPLMAALLSVPLPVERYAELNLSPQQQKQLTQDLIIGITMEVAERGAFLELWEDLHWADPSTLELIGLLIEQTPTAGLMLVLTARPEFVPPWPLRSYVTPITLNRLERQHTTTLVAQLVEGKPLPDEVLDHIVTKADGVPLYVEELTKAILSSNLLRDTGERLELTGPLASLSIPETLQESLMARLDRLPQVRELVQIGAVLGREFTYGLISGLSELDDTALQTGLGQLVENELLYQRGRPPRAKYIFKHALVQDAAYASLLRRARQHTHLRAAELLETEFPEFGENQPELLARHYSEAGATDKAIGYYLIAGQRSLLRSANAEAIAQLGAGLQLIGTLADSPERSQQELTMLLLLAPALVATKGYAAEEVEPAYVRALEVCQSLGDTEKQFTVLLGLSMFYFIKADILHALRLAEDAAELARIHPAKGFDLAAARQLGLVLCYRGEFAASRLLHEQVAEHYEPDVHGSFAFIRGGSDFGVGSIAILGGFSLFPLGYPNQAKKRCAEAITIAKKINHPLSLAFAHWGSAHFHAQQGDHAAFLKDAEIVEILAEEKGFSQYTAWITGQRGVVLLQQNRFAEAIVALTEGIDRNRSIGGKLFETGLKASLAEAYGRNGQIKQGFAIIAEAFKHMAATEERYDKSKAYLVKGRLLLLGKNADPSEAEVCFQKAIKVAQSQSAKLWELRAATNLARLWQDQGKNDAARDLLIPVYNWFTEGFEVFDLQEANALLEELA